VGIAGGYTYPSPHLHHGIEGTCLEVVNTVGRTRIAALPETMERGLSTTGGFSIRITHDDFFGIPVFVHPHIAPFPVLTLLR